MTIDPNYGIQVIINTTIKIQTLNINCLRSFCSTIQKQVFYMNAGSKLMSFIYLFDYYVTWYVTSDEVVCIACAVRMMTRAGLCHKLHW